MATRIAEATFQKKVLKYLKTLPRCWFYKVNDTVLIGLPDVIGSYYGMFFGIELKAKAGKTTKIQECVLKDIFRSGGFSLEAKSLEEIINFMEVVKCTALGMSHKKELQRLTNYGKIAKLYG